MLILKTLPSLLDTRASSVPAYVAHLWLCMLRYYPGQNSTLTTLNILSDFLISFPALISYSAINQTLKKMICKS